MQVETAASPFFADFERLPREVPAWVDELRRAAMDRFLDLGFPTQRDEDWKFTNLNPLARLAFALEPGRGVTDWSNPAIENHLARYANFQKHAFVALNTAFLDSVHLIEIPAGARETVRIEHESEPGVSHPRTLAVIGEGAEAAIVESFSGDHKYFTNAVTEIVCGDGAIVDHYKLQNEARDAFHISTIQVQQGRDSVFTSRSFAFGGALARTEINAVLETGSECTLNGLYVVNGIQHVDTRTAIDHAKPHAASHELYKGILNGSSSAVFNGKIIVRKDAQKTDAKQTNKNLVLSENATINTKPQLEIFADDVRCTHGATVGQLDPDSIFYLRSRGIGQEDARAMLIEAFAREIIDAIKIPELREQTLSLLKANL
ncbi:MAG TPA: Fe-S cluster assembly protein SufD [Bryobacteraceae bacterium]|nr:Fe-S cluster assembly protein SufD [Bryobacteraceae bacterium]